MNAVDKAAKVEANVLIGVCIVLGLALLVGIKVWVQRFARFKMDESAILQSLKGPRRDGEPKSAQAISSATNIAASRVSDVCTKSKLISRSPGNTDSWSSNRQT